MRQPNKADPSMNTSSLEGTERQPLLQVLYGEVAHNRESVAASELNSGSGADPEAPVEDSAFSLSLFTSLLADSVPVILSYILQNSLQTVSILVAGRLGPDELSVAAFSLMLAFVTGWCVALGGTTALDTFGSQAFTGGSNRSDVSVYFQRCLIVLWFLLIPVCIVWIYSAPILVFLGQDVALSDGVERFLTILCAGAPAYVGFESLKKYLQCQGIMRLSTYALLIVSPVNIVLNVVLIHYTSLGILGSPVAVSITYWFAFLVLIGLTWASKQHRENATWTGFKIREAIDPDGVWMFLKLALPGILMVGTEWAAFEIVALVAGMLGPLPLAAQSVIMTTDQILNTVPFGIGVAASARVGNQIGARSVSGAKHAAHASAMLSVVMGSLIMLTMLATKDVFGYLFSDDEAVVLLVSKVMPLVASFQVADGLAGSCGGVLRGQGRQHLGALFNLVAYYVLALPVGVSLALNTSLGLVGLWMGQVGALFIVGLGEYATVWLGTDWEKEIEKGIERNKHAAQKRAMFSDLQGRS